MLGSSHTDRGPSSRLVGTLVAAILVASVAVIGSAPAGAQKRDRASALFVVNANGGTAAAASGGEFALQITGVDPDALFFTDRPARDTGVIGVGRMLSVLSDGEVAAPNGVVEVYAGEQGPVALAVELGDLAYDEASGTLAAQARRLKRTKGSRLAHYDDRLDRALPETFGNVALFIDSSPVGSTNFCRTQVQNYTAQDVTLTDQFKWGTDVWDPPPPSDGFTLDPGSISTWQSDGGFARGCGNSTTWQVEDGTTFHTSITDPYGSSPNSITCTSSDPSGHPCQLDTQSTTRGASIDAIYYLCDLSRQSGCPGN
jgi:hypothetical protein